MRHAVAAAVLSAILAAGCLQGPGTLSTQPEDGRDAPQRLAIPMDPMPEGEGHDHADPTQHRFLWNYDVTAHDPMLSNAANIAGLHALDLQQGYLFGAVWGSHAASVDGGLVIWDLADPLHPEEVGRWTVPGSVGGDRSMEATSDGNFVVLGTETVTCYGHLNPAGAVGAYLIDTHDKARPFVADFLSNVGGVTPGGVLEGSTGAGGYGLLQHTVTVAAIDGADYAFIFGKVFRIERAETGGRLVFVTRIDTGHDIFVRNTPWNTTWGLAAREKDLAIYDLSDPAKPVVIGQWALPPGESTREGDLSYYLHTADAAFLPDGRGGTKTLIVQTSEDTGDHVSPLWILDGDPLRSWKPGDAPIELEALGGWQNPGNHTAGELTFSLHDPRLHDGLLTMSSYHGGLWQLDLRDPSFWAEPAPIAYAVWADGDVPALVDPAENAVANRLCGFGSNIEAPSTIDQEIGVGGILYAGDVYGGLYTFAPTADHPVYGSTAAATP